MPEPAGVSGFRPAVTGLFGKLPARGDFVRRGLPEDFVAPWDSWCRDVLSVSRAALGAGWEAAWMEAPVWRFCLAPGACGPQAVLGVWLPSVDKVGRHYPFGLIALAGSLADLRAGGGWLDMAEAAGLAGVVDDAPPEDLAMLLAGNVPDGDVAGPGWWTDGSPLVAARRLDVPGLIPPASCADMLRDAAVAEPG